MEISTLMAVAATIHIVAVVIWVGGMIFAHVMLRPIAASQLEPPARLTLWVGIFGRFFPWVWGCIAMILATGFWIIFAVFGGLGNVGAYVHAMMGIGIIMMLIFFFVYFVPYQRLKAAVAAQDWPTGGKNLTMIRHLVGVNMLLGVVTIAARYLMV